MKNLDTYDPDGVYRRGMGPRRRGCSDIRNYLADRTERSIRDRTRSNLRTECLPASSYGYEESNSDEVDPLTQSRGFIIRLPSVNNQIFFVHSIVVIFFFLG